MVLRRMFEGEKMKYQTIFRDPEPHYGGWFTGLTVEAKNIKEARKKCGEIYGYDGEFDTSWLKVKRVKK